MQVLNRELLLQSGSVVELRVDLGHQLAVLGFCLEIPTAALAQLLLQPPFPGPERVLDGAVLMGDIAVVTDGDRAQMGAELAIAAGVMTCVAADAVAETGAQADRAINHEVTREAKSMPKAALQAGLIQSLSQCLLPGLSAWVGVGGIAHFPCVKAHLPQPISS